MAWMRWVPVLFGIVACGPGGSDTDASDGPEAYPSDFATGKHRAERLVLEPQDQGEDFDGDGTADNNLPFVLETADELLSSQDLSPATFNTQIEAQIAEGSLNVLFDSAYTEGELSIAVLNGIGPEGDDTDAPVGDITVDPTSLGSDGRPVTVLGGAFADQTTFEVGAERAVLIVPFVPGEPPSPVPMERVKLAGTLDGDTLDATLTGLIPAQELADDVLVDLIPEEGVGNLSKEQILNTLNTIVGLETMADIDMGDGRRAVSCTLSVRAAAADWLE